MTHHRYHFEPADHEPQLRAVLGELEQLDVITPRELDRIVRLYPKADGAVLSKSELIRGYRWLERRAGRDPDAGDLIPRLRKKPVRTLSGVATVTVLTKPFPCPGRCIFCPNDVRMPKSYLSDEPGAQRAAQHAFDPYLQTYFRLRALSNIGHPVDKVELIVLGGTWSFYPEAYQIWFVLRCFEALNDFVPATAGAEDPASALAPGALPFEELALHQRPETPALANTRSDEGADADGARESEEPATINDRAGYNRTVARFLRQHHDGRLLDTSEAATWEQLEAAQNTNEGAAARCVGLVLETRPDHLAEDEVLRLRRLGATKVQIGFQSLSDEVLALNHRGHDVAATRRAVTLLRHAGFKLHAHWMPNLYGSSPELDLEDFQRIFDQPELRPDELKIYPCSLIESAELMDYYRRGDWRPYTDDELTDVLVGCLERVPPWCRITRVIRDIPSQDIVVGNQRTNFRQLAEQALARRGGCCRDIRSREVRGRQVRGEGLHLRAHAYSTGVGEEVFLEYVDGEERIAGFLRLSLPEGESFVEELKESAVIREVHVYGALAGLGEAAEGRAQHQGLGRRLIEEAARRAATAGYRNLAVISAIGTREYYRRQGFRDGRLYQHRGLNGASGGG
ncbi:MAG: tRNA uridine(34) 5-carboxymethylaminomethyl modification radical SAM/GNAT enzyme Elp3 [Acidobacteriota bacterium]|nr:tRNA uridine(34) 5-carboxymethylaminomethyl modification radical SAM/GNAT enzyme Elp3 [Acidobacteriota bacterium]